MGTFRNLCKAKMRYKYRRFYKSTQGVTTLAKKVNRIQRIVNRDKPEKKHYEIGAIGGVMNNDPQFVLFPTRQITTGTSDFGSRIGDKITQVNYNFRGDLLFTGVSGVRVRLIAFIYKHNPDQAISTWSTIINLYLTSSVMNGVTAPLAYKDWDNNSSFATLYDKYHILNPVDSTGTAVVRKKVDFNVKIPKAYQEVNYINGGQTPTKNELFICAISSSDSAVTCDYNSRYTYYG